MPESKMFTRVNEFMRTAFGSRTALESAKERALYDSIGARLRKLHDAVHGAIGQFVLVIKKRLGSDEGCFKHVFSPHVEASFRLGILQAPGLIMTANDSGILGRTQIDLVTSHYTRTWRGVGGWSIRVKSGPIKDDILDSFWMHLDTLLEGSERPRHGPVKRLEVVVGNEAVFAWATREHYELLVRDMVRSLGREVSFPALAKRQEHDRNARASAIESLWAEYLTLRGREGARRRFEEVLQVLGRTLEELKELGIDEATPNVHLIRHIAQQFKFPL